MEKSQRAHRVQVVVAKCKGKGVRASVCRGRGNSAVEDQNRTQSVPEC